MLSQVLTEDAKRSHSSHDFGKDIIPRMVTGGLRVFAYPFQGYWVDVGTVEAYWQTQMDLLKAPPPVDLNDRAWIIHTRSEERPPVSIIDGAVVKDSMITDGCIVSAGARVEKSILSPGVYVGPNAVIRESRDPDRHLDRRRRPRRARDRGQVGPHRPQGARGQARAGREARREPRHHDDRQERRDPGLRAPSVAAPSSTPTPPRTHFTPSATRRRRAAAKRKSAAGAP